MSEEVYEDGSTNFRLVNVSAIYDEDGSIKFINDSLSSSNFDGYIFSTNASVGVTQITAGQSIGIQSSTSSVLNFYPIIKVEAEDPVLTSPYTGAHYIYYLDNNETFTSSYSSSAASVIIRYDDWEGKNLGTSGWTITSGGNAIFSNIAARGRIEATSGYIGDAYSGWEIGANLLSNASVGFYAPSAFSSAEIAIFSGSPFTGRTTAPFRVNYGGQMNATGASISGALTATTLNVGGSAGITYDGSIVTIGSSVVINSTLTTNSLQVGASPALLRIANDVEGTNDGIYIDPYNFWYSDGKFSVGGSANSACWNGNALSVKGNIIATSGSFSGDITASAGRFVGALSVSSSGAIYAGTNVDSGQRTVLNASGLFGYHSSGIEAFALPVSGSPRIGTFTIIPTGIVSQSASNANMIYGNVDASGSVTDGIVIRGSRSLNASAAIYTVQNGVETSYATGNGFYVDENARFKLKGATGSLAFDGTDLYVSGNINATSGAFTGSVSAQFITASIGRIGGFLLSASSITASNSPTTAVGMTTGASAIFAGATSRTGVGAKFWVSNAGNLYAVSASILGDSIINGTNIGNGAGNISSNLRVGTSALGANTSGTDNLALGDYALYSNTTGINNLAVGASSLFANNGLYNTAIGYRTLATNNSGGNNVAVGKDSLEKNTTGFFNVALGSAAIANKGVGDHNIALGSSTLYNLLDGSENLAFGQQALSIAKYVNENVAIGSYALGSLGATGSYKSNSNIAIGYYAGIDILNGSANVFIGYRGTGSDVSRNIFIANGSNQLGLRIDESQKVYLYGDLAINTNAFYVDSALSEVGIGTAAPASALHIVGGLYVTGDANIVGNVSAAQLLGSTPSGTRALAATRATTTAADEIAIFRSSIGGADTTKFSFQANGRLRAEGDGSFGGDLAITGATTLNSTTDITGLLTTNRNVTAGTVNGIVINSTNNYTTNWNAIKFTRNTVDLGFIRVASAVGAPTLVSASDYRLKKNIEDDSRNFTEVINGLRPVTFEWKNIENSGKTYGFIAHEVQEYVPEAVGGTKDNVDENGNIIPQDLTHQPFVYYLIGAFKESVQEIQTLKAKMIELESKINELGGNNG